MGNARKTQSWLGLLAALLVAGVTHASTIQITIDTKLLSGVSADLTFDFFDGGPPPNSVTIFDFTIGGGSLSGSPSTSGNVIGDLSIPPGMVTLNDDLVSFNEYLQNGTLGTSITFSFLITDNGFGPPPFSPDTFAFFLLDPNNFDLPLISTSGPGDALFIYNIGLDSQPDVFTSDSVRVTAEVVSVPEPDPVALLIAGLMALGVVRAVRTFHVRKDLLPV